MKLLLVVPVLLAAPFFGSSPSAAAARPADHAWAIDTAHSSVVFKLKHMNASMFYGTFEQITGTVTLDPAAPDKGSVAIVIPVDSLRTRDEKRDGHLKGPDFFNAKENPEITFTSTSIAKAGAGAFAVKGKLSLAGKEKEVALTVQDTGEGEMMGTKLHGWETTFTIKRSDFGMNYGVAQKALSDEVTIMIGLEGHPAK